MDVYRLPDWVKTDYDLELYHSGSKGMRWGHRRYQNKDGSLTPLGRLHYGYGPARATDAGRANTATGITRKAGTSSHVQRSFHTNDSNYTLVGTDSRAPSRNEKDKELNEYLDRNLSDTFSKLEFTSGSFHRNENIKKLSDTGMKWYETTHVHSKLNDESIDGLRDSEVALIGANYLHTSYRQIHSMSKERARNIGSGGNRTNYDALSPYAASRHAGAGETVSDRMRDAKDWQDANIESYNRLTNNGRSLPRSNYDRSQYTSDHIKLRSELYNEKRRKRY